MTRVTAGAQIGAHHRPEMRADTGGVASRGADALRDSGPPEPGNAGAPLDKPPVRLRTTSIRGRPSAAPLREPEPRARPGRGSGTAEPWAQSGWGDRGQHSWRGRAAGGRVKFHAPTLTPAQDLSVALTTAAPGPPLTTRDSDSQAPSAPRPCSRRPAGTPACFARRHSPGTSSANAGWSAPCRRRAASA